MSRSGTMIARRSDPRAAAVDAWAVLSALPDPVLVVREGGHLIYANAAAEQFFDAGAATLLGAPLDQLLPPDSPVFALIDSVRQSGHSVSEYGVVLETPRLGSRPALARQLVLVLGDLGTKREQRQLLSPVYLWNLLRP